jgi:cytochrome c oxidase subunit 2
VEPESVFQIARASNWAGRVDGLFLALLALSLFVGIVLAGLVIIYVVRYRAGHPAERRAHVEHAELLETLWTLVPLVIFIGLFVVGARTYLDMSRPPADALDIYGVGKQWMWKFQHPSGRAEINTLHLPLGRAVRIVLASDDVIHSFYVPAFRVKKDAVPGRYNEVWFTPTRVGTYRLLCAEFCGADHSRMQGFAVVVSQADYARWSAHAGTVSDLAAEGERLYRALGCGGCHDAGSTVHAPPLANIYGRRIPTDRGFVTADEAYLRDSILVPNRVVTAGYAPVMPAYAQQITEGDVLRLIAYLKTLTDGSSP